jgi:hypothetical protein
MSEIDVAAVWQAANVRGLVAVARIRMDALRREIEARDWDGVEWEWDRVHSSLAKLEHAVKQ